MQMEVQGEEPVDGNCMIHRRIGADVVPGLGRTGVAGIQGKERIRKREGRKSRKNLGCEGPQTRAMAGMNRSSRGEGERD